MIPASLLLLCCTLTVAPEIVDVRDIAPVWSGHPVGFCLLTRGDHQFAAFYDADRKMTVASRRTDSTEWHFSRLPETVKWDSHNYITMAVDDENQLHLCGNMHVDPLVYFRTAAPLDIDTLERCVMTGDREDRVTYPHFFRGSSGEFLFRYRDGQSGNGEELYNLYEPASRTWTRFLDKPLTSGEGERNAYIIGPIQGPDKRFHLCWVWRETFDCATNHDLCYAASPNLRDWFSGAGAPLALPMTLSTSDIVDPVPVHGGIINGNTRIGFDSRGRPVISYHKFDEQGHTQVYNARLENGHWRSYQTSRWEYRWEFGGGGTIPFEVHVSPVTLHDKGILCQKFSHKVYGQGAWALDEQDFHIVENFDLPPEIPPSLNKVESPFEGMGIRRAMDDGSSGLEGIRYFLQWETLPQHRDKPWEGDPPPPSMLRLVTIKAGS